MSVKSKAAVIVDKGKVEVRTIDIPAPKRGEVLVRQKRSSPVYVRTAFLHRSFRPIRRWP